jgi:uncharacterized protein
LSVILATRAGSVDVHSQVQERLHVLDVLRGIALLGMFLVHFSNYATGGSWADGIYQKIVALLFEERFWVMFGMLFGAGFAIQLRRADARGESFLPKYLRRLAVLAAFGVIADGIFGYNVLLGYAIWGLALPLVRKWSTPVLVAALIVSAASMHLYTTGRAAYGVVTKSEAALQAEWREVAAYNRAFNQANRAAQDSTDFSEVVAARLRRMPWFYSRPYSFLPVNTLTLFLLGVLAVRLGLFDRPAEHRRLIVALALFGAAAWAFETWVPDRPPTSGSPLVREMVLSQLAGGYGLIRGMWLSFTYMGVVLFLVAWNPQWLRPLAVFSTPGRTALTSYMTQIIILDLLFSKYALGLTLTPLVGLVAGVALFAANVVFSRWWLARHPFGPLEWLWRSATYARWQPWRISEIQAATKH